MMPKACVPTPPGARSTRGGEGTALATLFADRANQKKHAARNCLFDADDTNIPPARSATLRGLDAVIVMPRPPHGYVSTISGRA
jgi:hypothetical protein